ncbi:MAG: hypothetical protein ACOVNV_00050, partial [Pirellulaceae bacterium]
FKAFFGARRWFLLLLFPHRASGLADFRTSGSIDPPMLDGRIPMAEYRLIPASIQDAFASVSL